MLQQQDAQPVQEQRTYGTYEKDEEERERVGQMQLGTGQKGQDSIGGCCTWTKAGLKSKRNHLAQDANNHEGYKEAESGNLPWRHDATWGQVLLIGLTSGTPSHKGTSRGGAPSACKVSAHAVLTHRVVRGLEPMECGREKRSRAIGSTRVCCSEVHRIARRTRNSPCCECQFDD